jgi:cell division protein FtsI/penicillin-binding protein 2
VNFSIGQGDTTVTPLQLTSVYAAIANGGTLWRPTIAKAVVRPDGTLVREIRPKATGRLPLRPDVLRHLQASLVGVTTNGTARAPSATGRSTRSRWRPRPARQRSGASSRRRGSRPTPRRARPSTPW